MFEIYCLMKKAVLMKFFFQENIQFVFQFTFAT